MNGTHSAGVRTGTRRALACLAAALALAAPARSTATPASDTQRRIAELLLADDARLATQLGSLGADSLPTLFEILEHGAYELDGSRQALTADQRQVLLHTLGRAPASWLQPLFVELADPAASPAAKAVALEVVGAGAGAHDMRTMIVLAQCDAGPLEQRALARQLEALLADALARDPRGYRLLAGWLRDAHPSLREAVVRALGAGREPEAIMPLASLLGGFPELDLTLLTQLARSTVHGATVVDDAALDRVRSYLEHEDLRLRAAAALVAGRFEDVEAVPILIDSLDHPHPSLSEQALWSLRRISGLELRSDSARWRAWYQRELVWWHERSEALFAELDSPESATAAAAVNEIARHRLFRNRLASRLTRALAHADASIGRQACGALRQLGAPSAVPALIDCLTDPDDVVRERAWQALKQITGRDLPPDPEAWRAAFPS